MRLLEKLTATRFTDLTGIYLCNIQPGHWQHIDANDNRMAQVGPIYRTKQEAMADHTDYLVRAGWMND